MKILLTGASGFIGKRLLAALTRAGHEVIAVGRKRPTEDGRFLNCDLVDDQAVETLAQHPDLQDVQAVVHMAALYDLTASISDCILGNVRTTENTVKLARLLPAVEIFHHVSTVAVAGSFNGLLPENMIDFKALGLKYDDAYAYTKMLSEQVLQDVVGDKMKLRIYRPGIVVGDSVKGHFDNINGPYYFMQFLASMMHRFPRLKSLPYLPLPYTPTAQFPLVTVDDVVAALAVAVTSPTQVQRDVYHLVDDQAPTMQAFLQDLFQAWGLSANPIHMKPQPFHSPLMALLKLPKELLTYVHSGAQFRASHFRRDFPQVKLHDYNCYKKVMFKESRRRFSSKRTREVSL